MATVDANPTNDYGDTANLCTAQVTSAVSTNVADRGGAIGPALLVLTTAIGATPTATYLIEGSGGGNFWYPLLYADSASAATVVNTTFVITTAGTVLKVIQPNQPVRFIRVTMSAVTNVTSTIDVFTFRN